jgi:hypothetical protein
MTSFYALSGYKLPWTGQMPVSSHKFSAPLKK